MLNAEEKGEEKGEEITEKEANAGEMRGNLRQGEWMREKKRRDVRERKKEAGASEGIKGQRKTNKIERKEVEI